MINILAVDDMPQWRAFHTKILNSIFKNAEFSLTVKNSAFEALQAAETNEANFSLIITDLQMELDFEPEHAGEWLIRNLKNSQKYCNTPIIIASASYDIRFIAEKYGTSYVQKQTIVQNPLLLELAIKEALHI